MSRGLQAKVQLIKEKLPAMVRQHNIIQFEARLTEDAQAVILERDSFMESILKPSTG